MSRGVPLYLVGLCLLAALAGCARVWIAEREPWRHEAEVACLNAGAVREGPSITILRPIEGPGICGADFPLRVAALGEPAVLGFGDEPVRPPAGIPGAYPPPLVNAPYPAPSVPAYVPAYPPAPPGEPLALTPGPPRRLPSAEETPDRGTAAAARDQPDLYVRPDGYFAPGQVTPLGRSGNPAIEVRPAAVTPAATLACPLVSALDRLMTDAVQPAALRWFSQPVTQIQQISAYSCRGMNGDPGAKISEHAFGNALDIAAFVLADGHRVSVKDGWHGAPEEQGFLHDVQAAACDLFTTVLAPGSNAYHYDHMHVDLMRRSSGRRICQPSAIPGEVAAARAGRYSRVRPGEPAFTGSIMAGRLPPPETRLVPDRPAFADDRSLAHAIPGAD